MSLGKIILCVGMAGIVISLALISIGSLFKNNEYMLLIGLIGIPVSFIIAVAGAIGSYLEPFVDRIRARNREADASQSDYNIKIGKL